MSCMFKNMLLKLYIYIYIERFYVNVAHKNKKRTNKKSFFL